MEISPPNLQSISLCKLSPSGRYLLIGNAYAQYFYVYQLFPPGKKCQCPYRICAVLFRGYTQASITDCSLYESQAEVQVLLNSANGTTHTYIIQLSVSTIQNLVCAH